MKKTNITLTIDCAKDSTKDAIHASIAQQMHFPDYYGANLDALHDCMNDALLEYLVVLHWKDTKASRADAKVQEIKKLLKGLLGHGHV